MNPSVIVKCPDCTHDLDHRTEFGHFKEKPDVYEKSLDKKLRAKRGDIWFCPACQTYYHTFDGKRSSPHGGYIREEGMIGYWDLLPYR